MAFNHPGTSQPLNGTFQLRSSVLFRPMPPANTALITVGEADSLWDGEWVLLDGTDTTRTPVIGKVTAASLNVAGGTDVPQSSFRFVHFNPGAPDVMIAKRVPTFPGETGCSFLTRIVDHDSPEDYYIGAPLKVALINFGSMSDAPVSTWAGTHAGLVLADVGEEYACVCESVPDLKGWVHVRYAPGTRRAAP